MIKNIRYGILALLALIATMGCEKEKLSIPPSYIHFDFIHTADYYITQDGKSSFKIMVGLTAAAEVDRTVDIFITSPTGAKEGQQYTVNKKSVTIPAGQTVDSIIVKGLYAGFDGGRRDSLVLSLTGGNASPMPEAMTYTLVMQQYCDVSLSMFDGEYMAQDYYEGSPDGSPYPVYLTPVGSTGPTSGTISLDGLWGAPVPFNVKLDWSNPSSFTTEVPTQAWATHPNYGPMTIRPSGKGSFSSCTNTLRIEYEVTVSAGSFGKMFTILTK